MLRRFVLLVIMMLFVTAGAHAAIPEVVRSEEEQALIMFQYGERSNNYNDMKAIYSDGARGIYFVYKACDEEIGSLFHWENGSTTVALVGIFDVNNIEDTTLPLISTPREIDFFAQNGRLYAIDYLNGKVLVLQNMRWEIAGTIDWVSMGIESEKVAASRLYCLDGETLYFQNSESGEGSLAFYAVDLLSGQGKCINQGEFQYFAAYGNGKLLVRLKGGDTLKIYDAQSNTLSATGIMFSQYRSEEMSPEKYVSAEFVYAQEENAIYFSPTWSGDIYVSYDLKTPELCRVTSSRINMLVPLDKGKIAVHASPSVSEPQAIYLLATERNTMSESKVNVLTNYYGRGQTFSEYVFDHPLTRLQYHHFDGGIHELSSELSGMNSCDVIDVSSISLMRQAMDRGLLAPITLSAQSQDIMDQLYPNIINELYRDGQYYMMPTSLSIYLWQVYTPLLSELPLDAALNTVDGLVDFFVKLGDYDGVENLNLMGGSNYIDESVLSYFTTVYYAEQSNKGDTVAFDTPVYNNLLRKAQAIPSYDYISYNNGLFIRSDDEGLFALTQIGKNGYMPLSLTIASEKDKPTLPAMLSVQGVSSQSKNTEQAQAFIAYGLAHMPAAVAYALKADLAESLDDASGDILRTIKMYELAVQQAELLEAEKMGISDTEKSKIEEQLQRIHATIEQINIDGKAITTDTLAFYRANIENLALSGVKTMGGVPLYRNESHFSSMMDCLGEYPSVEEAIDGLNMTYHIEN